MRDNFLNLLFEHIIQEFQLKLGVAVYRNMTRTINGEPHWLASDCEYYTLQGMVDSIFENEEVVA